jgi:hypothetical protein
MARQLFTLEIQPPSKCSKQPQTVVGMTLTDNRTGTGNSSSIATDDCVTIRSDPVVNGSAANSGCATVLTDRWPWWVSILPCDASDARQYWNRRLNHGSDHGMQLISSFVKSPWPSGV